LVAKKKIGPKCPNREVRITLEKIRGLKMKNHTNEKNGFQRKGKFVSARIAAWLRDGKIALGRGRGQPKKDQN